MINQLFDQFLSNILNQNVEVSSKDALYQCMDLAYAWIFSLGIPKAAIQHQYAYQVFTEFNDLTLKHFEIIANSDTFVPQKGDLGVFKKEINGVAGHICICTGVGDTKSFQSVDQNWDGKQHAPQLITHNYNNFLGVLRPKLTWNSTQGELVITSSTRIPQIENKEVQQIVSEIDAKNKYIYQLEHKEPVYTYVEKPVEVIVTKEVIKEVPVAVSFTNPIASSLYALASLIERRSTGNDVAKGTQKLDA